MIKVKSIAWFAGLYEGEGTVNIEKRKLTPRVHIEMTDEDVIRKAAKITGGNYYCSRKGRNKPVYRLALNKNLGMQWLLTIYVLLGKRRKKQAEKAIRYWISRKRRVGGWEKHRKKYGCKCSQLTGSCQAIFSSYESLREEDIAP